MHAFFVPGIEVEHRLLDRHTWGEDTLSQPKVYVLYSGGVRELCYDILVPGIGN